MRFQSMKLEACFISSQFKSQYLLGRNSYQSGIGNIPISSGHDRSKEIDTTADRRILVEPFLG